MSSRIYWLGHFSYVAQLSYFFFAVIFESCWFYNGFTPVFALQRRGLMKGAAEQLQYIMRKEKNFFETRVTEYQTGGALAWD